MNVWLVVEGATDVAIVRAVLLPALLDHVSIVPTGRLSNLSSAARTLLVKHREPVALLADTGSLDESAIYDRYTTLMDLLRAVAGSTPFKVIVAVPELEGVFFEAPEQLGRLFPAIDHASLLMLYKTQPKQALTFLFQHGGGPKTLTALLDRLTTADIERVRQAAPLRELCAFIEEQHLAGSVAAHKP